MRIELSYVVIFNFFFFKAWYEHFIKLLKKKKLKKNSNFMFMVCGLTYVTEEIYTVHVYVYK